MAEIVPWLRRIERDTVRACCGMALLAWVIGSGRPGPPLGVLAGGALIGISYRGIKGGIDAAAEGVTGSKFRRAIGLVKFFTRYGILTAAAYVIIARLTLPPVAVIAGVSSLFVAVAVEAMRSLGGSAGAGGK